MVQDVSGPDPVVQDVDDLGVVTVHGQGGPFEPFPVILSKVGDTRIGVLQPRDDHQPGIDDKVRTDVHEEDDLEPEFVADVGEETKHGNHAERRQEHLEPEFLGEELVGGKGIKMVRSGGILFLGDWTSPGASGMDEQVEGPANHQEIIFLHS